MANKGKGKAKVDIEVSDNGTIKATKKKMDSLSKSTDKVTNSNKGVIGTSGKAGKDFSRMASGMGGLVAAYATVAANMFALSAAFTVLSNAADFDSMIISSKNLATATGNDFINIAKSVHTATGAQIDFADALAITNKAVASGIGADQVAQFTELATKAAQTFGGTTTDAMNRFVDAVLRGRTELVNKLGIVISADKAYTEYSQSIGKTVQQLTEFEKRQAITNSIISEGNKSIGQTVIDPNPYQVLAVTFRDLAQEIASMFTATGGIASELVNLFNTSKDAVLGLSAVLVGSVLSKLGPTPTDLRNRSKAARQANKRSIRFQKQNARRIRNIKKDLNNDLLGIDRDYNSKNLAQVTASAEKHSAVRLQSMKSFKPLFSGEDMSSRQIGTIKGLLTKAEKGVGSLKDVPRETRARLRKYLNYMSGDVKVTEKEMQKGFARIKTHMRSIGVEAKSVRNKFRSFTSNIVRQNNVAAAKIAKHGIFTSLPSGMNPAIKGYQRLKAAGGKLINNLGTIGLAVTLGISAWTLYRKTFDKTGLALDSIKDKMKEFGTRQSTLSETLETSSTTFGKLIAEDTASTFSQRANIISNNIRSVIALIKEANKEFVGLVTKSGTGEAIRKAEEELSKAEKFRDNASSALKRRGTPRMNLRSTSDYTEAEKEVKRLEAKILGLYATQETLDKAAERKTLEIAKGSIKKLEEELDAKFEGNIPKLLKDKIDAAKLASGEVYPHSSSGDLKEQTSEALRLLSEASQAYARLGDSVTNVEKRSKDYAAKVIEQNKSISLLPKEIKLAYDSILSTEQEADILNLEKLLLSKKALGGSVKEVKALKELAKGLGFGGKEIDDLVETKDGLGILLKRFRNTKTSVEELALELKNAKERAVELKSAADALSFSKLAANSDAKNIAYLEASILHQKNTFKSEESRLLALKTSLGKGVVRNLAGAQQALVLTKKQLVELRKQYGIQKAKEELRKGELKVRLKQLKYESDMNNILGARKVLVSTLSAESTSSIGEKLRLGRQRENIVLLNKEVALTDKLREAKKIDNLSDRGRAVSLVEAQLENLILEKEIIEARRALSHEENARLSQISGDYVSAAAHSMKSEAQKALNLTENSISKLVTGYANGVRAGVGSFFDQLIEGNVSMTEALGAMGDAILETMSEVATDYVTEGLLDSIFNMSDPAKTTAENTTSIDANIKKLVNGMTSTSDTGEEPSIFNTLAGAFGGMWEGAKNLLGFGVGPISNDTTGVKAGLSGDSGIDMETGKLVKSNEGLIGSNSLLEGVLGVVGQATGENTGGLFASIAQSVISMAMNAATTATKTASDITLVGAIVANTGAVMANTIQLAMPSVGFAANGGVLSSKGFTPLANGGVATQAQQYIIGEGRKNEAVVPLPNNREIPVELKGGGGETTIVNNYDFTNADPASEARIRGMIKANGRATFGEVFKQIDRGGTFAKKTGRRR